MVNVAVFDYGAGNLFSLKAALERNGAQNVIIIKSIQDFMPILGICLGMEMLFNHSEEGTRDGLKILDGKVIILPKKKVKVPHMGWNNLEIIKKVSYYKVLRMGHGHILSTHI